MPMIDTGYVQRMARYNRWQNQNLYGVADALADAERRRDRGAFFGSIHATLNHLLWADRIWMHRLAGTPKPDGGIPELVSIYDDWNDLTRRVSRASTAGRNRRDRAAGCKERFMMAPIFKGGIATKQIP